MKYWLVTYQVSRDSRMSWSTWNEAIYGDPAGWFLNKIDQIKSTGYTNIVLLNAIEITQAHADALREVLE